MARGSRRIPPALVLAATALAAALLIFPWVVHADAEAAAPGNLTAQLVNGGVLLIWAAPAEDAVSVTGYEILRRRTDLHDPGDFQPLVGDTQSTATSYTDATATEAGKRYTYRVKAHAGQRDERVVQLRLRRRSGGTHPHPHPNSHAYANGDTRTNSYAHAYSDACAYSDAGA